MKIVVMGLCVSVFASFTANAELRGSLKVSVCIGQYSSLCPEQAEAKYGCEAAIEKIEREICKINNPDGTMTLLPSNSFQTSFKKGNRCDYTTYIVVCQPKAVLVKWTKADAMKVSCDALRGVVWSGSDKVAFFPHSPREALQESYQDCLIAVVQAKKDGSSVMISTEGEVIPEDGSLVRKFN